MRHMPLHVLHALYREAAQLDKLCGRHTNCSGPSHQKGMLALSFRLFATDPVQGTIQRPTAARHLASVPALVRVFRSGQCPACSRTICCADAPNAYPIGQMMWVVVDEDIGAKGVPALSLSASKVPCLFSLFKDMKDGERLLRVA